MASTEHDAEIIQAARAGFLDEAADMLQQFEQSLLVMETAPDDAENLNAAFRAAHTIKGTAGLFGCDAVVAFTHEVETLMEALRSGSLKVDDDIIAALLHSRDQIGALIDEVRSGKADAEVAARSVELGELLCRLRGAKPTTTAAPATAALAAQTQEHLSWHLSLRFGADALRNGLDPLAFIRYLGSLATITGCRTLDEAVPSLEQLDAEDCHLGFEIRLVSSATAAEIERVFEFAADDCSLVLLDPDATALQWQELLQLRSGSDAAQRSRLQQIWDDLGAGPARPQAASSTADASNAAGDNHDHHLAGDSAAEVAADAPAVERREAAGDRRSAAAGRRSRGDETRFVKVRADKLDHLIDLIGELVIAGSGAQMVASHAGDPNFLEATQRVADLVQATRDGALALRMVPVGETFTRFQRVVRDISKQLGKEIELVVTGGDTELDKSMVEVIGDPLMHLVRNSLDHGMETPSERVAAGKPSTGRLGLNAYHEAGSIVIEVSDDGRGLQRERILKKAIERGIVAPGVYLTDPEVWQLIFAPGFSTADAVTDLSGRGVGMDVVRRNIESLRGQVTLASTQGRGTTTQIRLPLTLAMIDGFLTLVGGVHYVLPLSVVSECIAVPRECLEAPGRTCGTFDLRGEVLPYLDLARFYGMAPIDGPRRSLVVVREGAVRIGLIVDRLLGEHQTVIKPLAGIFKPLEALAGSTILGSGDVALVLDMQGLMHAATRMRPADRPHDSARLKATSVD